MCAFLEPKGKKYNHKENSYANYPKPVTVKRRYTTLAIVRRTPTELECDNYSTLGL